MPWNNEIYLLGKANKFKGIASKKRGGGLCDAALRKEKIDCRMTKNVKVSFGLNYCSSSNHPLAG